MSIVIVEGIDRVGKTTLCNALAEHGFIYLKDSSPRPTSKEAEDAKLFTFASIVSNIKANSNAVADRLHLTELVYGRLERGYLSEVAVDVDESLSKRDDVILVLLLSTDLFASGAQHGSDLSLHQKAFINAYTGSAIKRKIIGTYTDIPRIVNKIVRW